MVTVGVGQAPIKDPKMCSHTVTVTSPMQIDESEIRGLWQCDYNMGKWNIFFSYTRTWWSIRDPSSGLQKKTWTHVLHIL